MKKTLLFLLLTFTSLYPETKTIIKEASPLLVVVIMIKNEEHVIEKTLQPYIDAGIDSFLVFDTGSTDKTVEITKDFFENHSITNAYIAQEPFVDFAVSRNRALDLAHEKFPKASFFLMPDAEWYMKNLEGLLGFCKEHRDDYDEQKGNGAYLLRITHPSLDFYTPRLLRNIKALRFVGAVHEVVMPAAIHVAPKDVYFELGSTKRGMDKSRNRWIRDRELLLAEYEKNPTDTRTLFYLAQTCDCLGKTKEAYRYYKERIEFKAWHEEDCIAHYRLAQVVERLDNSEKGWQEALSYYLKAFAICPTRIEPLIKIAAHYWQNGQHALSYLFALHAGQLPYPEKDILFIEKNVYSYERYEILSKAAWYVGEYEKGEWATRQALRQKPEEPHLLRNLAFYIEKRNNV